MLSDLSSFVSIVTLTDTNISNSLIRIHTQNTISTNFKHLFNQYYIKYLTTVFEGYDKQNLRLHLCQGMNNRGKLNTRTAYACAR